MNVVRLEDGDFEKQRHLLVDPSSGNKKTPNQGPSWTDRRSIAANHSSLTIYLKCVPCSRIGGCWSIILAIIRHRFDSVFSSVPSYLYRSFFPRFHRKWTWATWMNRIHLCTLGLSLEAMAKRHSRSPEVQVPIDATRRRWNSNITTFGI